VVVYEVRRGGGGDGGVGWFGDAWGALRWRLPSPLPGLFSFLGILPVAGATGYGPVALPGLGAGRGERGSCDEHVAAFVRTRRAGGCVSRGGPPSYDSGYAAPSPEVDGYRAAAASAFLRTRLRCRCSCARESAEGARTGFAWPYVWERGELARSGTSRGAGALPSATW
jgi:hypothetical protein